MIRILFTGGGTGGHIYPIVAVAEELRKMVPADAKMDLRYFGAARTFNRVLKQNGIRTSRILSAKLRRYFDLRNFVEIPLLLPLSLIQALWKVFWFMPDVLFSKGGPGSLPVVMASRFYRIPVVIHDSDVLVGLANRLASSRATRIAVSFESTAGSLVENKKLAGKVALTGNPIRRSLITGDLLEHKQAKRIFGFEPEKPLILVMGGSQGSVKINGFMMEIAQELMKDFQILHQAGAKNFSALNDELNLILKNYSKEEKKRYKPVIYFEEKDLQNAYIGADLVVSRASSGSIFEIAAFAKPSILIPLPRKVVGEHQILNAYEYAKTGASVVIEEANLEPNLFLTQLRKLFSEPEKLSRMSEAAKKFSKPEAAKIIAEEVLKLSFSH